MLAKPNFAETPPYFQKYIETLPFTDLIEALEKTSTELENFYAAIIPEKHDYAYDQNKWTIKQVLQHCIDCERVFTYRAMRSSRLDDTLLPGFSEDDYALNDNCHNLTLEAIIEDFKLVRASTIQFYKNSDAQKLAFMVQANKWQTNALQMGWMTCGHYMHHAKVVEERYLG